MAIITLPLPNIFSNGTTADALAVNANLNQITGNVNSNALEAAVIAASGGAALVGAAAATNNAGATVQAQLTNVGSATGATNVGMPATTNNSGTTVSAQLINIGSATGSANVGFTATGTGAVARTGSAKLSDIVSAKDFGAIGNAVADDTVSIQAALTAMPAVGGRVYLPQSTNAYLTTAALVMAVGSVTLEGPGNSGAYLFQATHNADFISVTAGNCEIRNIGFKCNAYGAAQHWCINAGASSDGLQIFNVRASACHSFVNFVGVNLQMLKFNVLNIQTTTGTGIQINNANATVIISDGLIGNAPGNQANGGIVLLAATSVQLLGINLFKMGNALWMSPAAAGTVGNVYAVACFFDTSTNGLFADGSAAGALIASIDFVGCWFNSHTGYGARLKGIVKGASFTGCQFGINTLDGLLLETSTVQDVIVTGCRAFANSGNGIHVTANVNLFHLIGNVCGPFTGSGGNTGQGIIVDAGTGNNYSIVGNDVHGNTGGSISNSATGTTCMVANNLGNANSQTAGITVTASPFSYTAGPSPETIYINTGTVSAVSVEGVTVYSQTNCTVRLRPKQTVIVTYTVAPGMAKTIEG